MTGLDVWEADGFQALAGKRVGVITNRTGVDAHGRSIVDLLAAARGVTLAAVFSPEHGFAAASEADSISSTTIRADGRDVPVFSLYGGGASGMRPKPEQLRGLDALVFDIQDAGARFYTYPATMAMALEATKAAKVPFFVLDRPNPVGGERVEGPLPDVPGLTGAEAVAYLPVPTRHGLTVGELALLHNASVKHPRLTVVPMKGWKRSMWFDETGLPWTPPSPNMPDVDAAALYPGVANLEFTNLSVGRGTPTPFGWIGAPWLDADAIARTMNEAGLLGVAFFPETRTPTKSVYAGKPCPGVRILLTDRDSARPLRVFAHLAAALRDRHPKEFDLNWKDSRKLIASEEFKKAYDRGAKGAELARVLDDGAARFAKARDRFLLYRDDRNIPRPQDLSIEELVGQLFMIAIDTEIAVAREADVRAGRLGGGILRWDRFTADQARATDRTLRDWSSAAPHPIPFWLSTDHEGGPMFTQRLYGGAPFPGNMALGAARSADLARESAEAMGRELRALGAVVTFAPDLDVNSNPTNTIIGLRSFGQDPDAVARLGRAALDGYRDAGVLAVPKHFPGHGDTTENSHLSLPVNHKTLAELERTELVPFRAAIEDGAPAIMPAHMVFPALGTAPDKPVTISSAAIEGFLRGRLDFHGLVFSDSLDMGAIANVYGSSEAATLSLLAGNDVLLLGKGDYPTAYAAVVAAVKSGRVPRERVEASVERILKAKERLGLFSGADPKPLSDEEMSRHRALARKIAESAVTVARNDGILPLKLAADRSLGIVLIHAPRYAEEAARFAAAVQKRHPKTVLVDVAEVSPSSAAVADALSRTRGCGALIVGTSQFGGPTPEAQAKLVQALIARSAPVVAVSLMNPYDLPVSRGARAAVCSYGITDSALEAAAAAIFGEIPAVGRLPVTVPGASEPSRD